MGRYRDWLHYQEAGRALRDELADLMGQRACIQAQATQGSPVTLSSDNCILVALQAWVKQAFGAGADNAAAPSPGQGEDVTEDEAEAQVAAEAAPLADAAEVEADPPAGDEQQADDLADRVVRQLMAELQDSPADPLDVLHSLTQATYGPVVDGLPFQSPQFDVVPGAVINALNEIQTQPRLAVPWWLRGETPEEDEPEDTDAGHPGDTNEHETATGTF